MMSLSGEFIKALLAMVGEEVSAIAGEYGGLGNVGCLRDATRSAVVESSGIFDADDHFLQSGHVDQTQEGLVVLLQSQESAEEGDAVNERYGAVNGVDDPTIATGAVLGAEFFAQPAVVGPMLADQIEDALLSVFVGNGYR